MLFASRVAENTNRRSRLLFQAPLYVPAPSTKRGDGDGTVHTLRNMPPWMANRDDPFGPDIAIPPLRVPANNSGSLASLPSPSYMTPPMSAGSTVSDASACTRSTDAKQEQPGNSGSERETIAGRSTDSANTRTAPMRDTAQGASKPPVLPMHTTLFPGGTSLPMLSTLANGVLVNHIPNGSTDAVMVSVALPKSEEANANAQSAPEQLQIASCKSDALSEISIPNTPFDPFGPSANARSGINPYFPTVSAIERQQGAALDVGPSVSDAQSETEGYCYDSKKEPKRQYVGPRINDRAKVDRKDTGFGVGALPATRSLKDRLWGFRRQAATARNETVHSSFIDLPRQPDTMLDRETQSERARASIITDTGASSTISSGTINSEDVSNTFRLNVATQPAQTDQAPRVPEKDTSAPGPVTESNEKQERRGSKGLGKSMMNKIRKLGHSKKRSSD